MCSSLYALLACCFAISSHTLGRESYPVYSSLTAHEWGTFTSIAGRVGQAVEWSPLTGSTDLPAFVEHFRNPGFKRGLRGTVRMETPVIYLYDSREEAGSVKVAFSKGVITEWYPRASRVEPAANIFDGTLYQLHPDGSIAWDSVTLSPILREEFTRENPDNHYYAARMTPSTPLRVKTPAGEQQEKFLFYRGVSTFSVPISAKLTTAGKLLVENRSKEEIPPIPFFSSGVSRKPAIASVARCGRMRFSIRRNLRAQSMIWAQTWKECSLLRVSARTKRTLWSKPGEIPGLRKAGGCCISCPQRLRTACCHSRSTLFLREP